MKNKLKEAQELLGQCKVSKGGCGQIKFKVLNGKKKGEVQCKTVENDVDMGIAKF